MFFDPRNRLQLLILRQNDKECHFCATHTTCIPKWVGFFSQRLPCIIEKLDVVINFYVFNPRNNLHQFILYCNERMYHLCHFCANCEPKFIIFRDYLYIRGLRLVLISMFFDHRIRSQPSVCTKFEIVDANAIYLFSYTVVLHYQLWWAV